MVPKCVLESEHSFPLEEMFKFHIMLFRGSDRFVVGSDRFVVGSDRFFFILKLQPTLLKLMSKYCAKNVDETLLKLDSVATSVDLRFESFLPGTKNHQNVDRCLKTSVPSLNRHLPLQNEKNTRFTD